jgi:hypothetical protein
MPLSGYFRIEQSLDWVLMLQLSDPACIVRSSRVVIISYYVVFEIRYLIHITYTIYAILASV